MIKNFAPPQDHNKQLLPFGLFAMEPTIHRLQLLLSITTKISMLRPTLLIASNGTKSRPERSIPTSLRLFALVLLTTSARAKESSPASPPRQHAWLLTILCRMLPTSSSTPSEARMLKNLYPSCSARTTLGTVFLQVRKSNQSFGLTTSPTWSSRTTVRFAPTTGTSSAKSPEASSTDSLPLLDSPMNSSRRPVMCAVTFQMQLATIRQNS